MNPFSITRFISTVPEDVSVSEQDKAAWLENPCTAVYGALCLALMNQTFKELMEGKNMNDVCEARGRFNTCVEMFELPEKIPTVRQGGLTTDTASAMKRKIEEFINEYRDSGYGSTSGDDGGS